MAEMLERQPSEVQRMLLRTSLVDRVNGELADLLAGRSGSEQMLLELEDANAFVVSLDPERTWFRYHQLLADFLRLELRRRFADEVPDLHRRAARWLADHGDVVEAVRHTLAAGDWSDAARLVADHSFSWVLDGQAMTIDAVLQAFPEGASADHPDLALAHAASELNHGRFEEAAAQLEVAESHVHSAPPARHRRLAVAVASLRLALARRSGQFSEVIEQVNLLDASISDESNDQMRDGERTAGGRAAESRDRRDVVRATRRRRAAPLRGSGARPDDRPTLPRGRVSRASRLPVEDWSRSRPRASAAVRRWLWPSGMAWTIGRYSRPRLGRSAAWRSGWASSTRESGGCAAPGRSPIRSVDPAAAVLLHVATGMLHAGRGAASARRSRPSPRRRGCSRSSLACTRSRHGSLDGSRPRRLASGCRTRRARRSPDSPPSPRK